MVSLMYSLVISIALGQIRGLDLINQLVIEMRVVHSYQIKLENFDLVFRGTIKSIVIFFSEQFA